MNSGSLLLQNKTLKNTNAIKDSLSDLSTLPSDIEGVSNKCVEIQGGVSSIEELLTETSSSLETIHDSSANYLLQNPLYTSDDFNNNEQKIFSISTKYTTVYDSNVNYDGTSVETGRAYTTIAKVDGPCFLKKLTILVNNYRPSSGSYCGKRFFAKLRIGTKTYKFSTGYDKRNMGTSERFNVNIGIAVDPDAKSFSNILPDNIYIDAETQQNFMCYVPQAVYCQTGFELAVCSWLSYNTKTVTDDINISYKLV